MPRLQSGRKLKHDALLAQSNSLKKTNISIMCRPKVKLEALALLNEQYPNLSELGEALFLRLIELHENGIDLFESSNELLQQAAQLEKLVGQVDELEEVVKQQQTEQEALHDKVKFLEAELAASEKRVERERQQYESLFEQLGELDQKNLVIPVRPEVIQAWEELSESYIKANKNKTEEGFICRLIGNHISSMPTILPDTLRLSRPLRNTIISLKEQ